MRLDTSHNRWVFTTVTVGSSLTSICLLQYTETPWWPPVGNNPVKMNRVEHDIEYAMWFKRPACCLWKAVICEWLHNRQAKWIRFKSFLVLQYSFISLNCSSPLSWIWAIQEVLDAANNSSHFKVIGSDGCSRKAEIILHCFCWLVSPSKGIWKCVGHKAQKPLSFPLSF